ncbi:MAG TPA: TolC family protein [Terriglobales bacterium]|nr:TolC family protein [Terriglobales bacterium]
MHRAAKLVLICTATLSWAWGQEPSPAKPAPPAPSTAVQAGRNPTGLLPRTSLQDVLRIVGSGKPTISSAQADKQDAQGDSAPQQPPAPGSAGVGVQLAEPGAPGQTGPPVTITFQDALARASKNYAQYLSAVTDAKVANEDRAQARDAMLPSLNYSQQYLGTQGNGKLASGRFVTNDGVHVYRVWGVVHQELPAGFFTLSPYKRVAAAAAIANAKAEIARRGLTVTVTGLYYGLIVAQREYATAQQAFDQAQHFLKISQDLERGGEVARSDVIKAQLQFQQQNQAFQEAALAMSKTRLDLAVVLSPNLDLNFNLVDDMDQAPVLPPFGEVETMAAHENQDVRAALEAVKAAQSDVNIARAGFFPTLTFDGVYGIEANALALRSTVAAAKELGPLPNPGYFLTASLNVPVWNWGATLSKLRQAEYKRQQAKVELSQAQRQALSSLYSFYNEAAVSRAEVQGLRQAADLAAESLRLTTLRYQAGEATALEVVDAQNTFAAARNAYDSGQLRYRTGLTTLQTLTGKF